MSFVGSRRTPSVSVSATEMTNGLRASAHKPQGQSTDTRHVQDATRPRQSHAPTGQVAGRLKLEGCLLPLCKRSTQGRARRTVAAVRKGESPTVTRATQGRTSQRGLLSPRSPPGVWYQRVRRAAYQTEIGPVRVGVQSVGCCGGSAPHSVCPHLSLVIRHILLSPSGLHAAPSGACEPEPHEGDRKG